MNSWLLNFLLSSCLPYEFILLKKLLIKKRKKDCLQSAPSHYAGAKNYMFQIPNV
jgi:hypothetical protein